MNQEHLSRDAKRLEHKVAIVTGAGSIGNIGEAYARALIREGASVVLADVNVDGSKALERRLTEEGGNANAVITDISSEADVQRMVDEAVRVFGGVDILVNNAGLHLTAFNVPPTTLSYAKWRSLFEVNLFGPLLCATACRPIMKSRGGGVIVNQSSMTAYTADSAYGISKLSLNGLTVALAAELAPDNIRVNGIAPGVIDSEAAMNAMGPQRLQSFLDKQMLKRVGRMTELAKMLIFLCSDDSSFITGQTYLVDGGAQRHPL